MKTIFMGLNTEPVFELPKKYNELPEASQNYFKREMADATRLRDEIEEVMAKEGACRLSWECEGRTRHQMHADQWAKALPQYDFEIDYNYVCNVTRKAE